VSKLFTIAKLQMNQTTRLAVQQETLKLG